MADFDFQWGGNRAYSSIYDRSCYGPHAFGKPRHTDYVIISENGKADCYASKDMMHEWNQMGEKLLDADFSDAYLERCRHARADMDEFYEKFNTTDLINASSHELLEWAKSLTRHIRMLGIFFVATQQAGTLALETTVRNRIRDVFGPENVEETFSIISQPTGMDIINREQLDFGELALQESVTEKQLLAHAEKHAWLFFQTFDKTAVIGFLKKKIDHIKIDRGQAMEEGNRLDASKAGLEKRQKKIFDKLGPITADQCTLLQNLALERLELKNQWAGSDWRFLPLFKQIAQRCQLPLTAITNTYGLDDLENALLDGKLLEPTLSRERRECYAVRYCQGKRTYFGKADVPALKIELGIGAVSFEGSIRGTVAHPGKVQGPVYVVTVGGLDELIRDENDFPQGAVMVVSMTQPNQLALVKKCSAIVADEGGSVSHAAVLAREMNKPCIVGTKTATSTFKTGDWVEVDAYAGVIRKTKQTDTNTS
ncbi:hypothetical protein HY994_06330 [Candidatus Micrarchaeota archaeon]|nr:hypothetical protein [Candidatus Micrarchaeota archaeon]